VPSGLNATTGKAGRACIRASATLALALPKAGLLALEARPYVGDLYLADISIPPALYQQIGLRVSPLFFEDSIIKLD
jgi:NAD(P)H-hydrate epimerase